MKKILLVEDNVMNQEGFFRLLSKRGYTVVVATSGESAITKYNEDMPDLILMDVSLPDMSGFDVTRVIRSLEASASRPATPIIAITAHAMVQDRVHAIEAGCTDFEPKPMEFKRLFQKIAKYTS